MTLRALRRSLLLATVAFAMAGAAVFAWGVWSPLSLRPPEPRGSVLGPSPEAEPFEEERAALDPAVAYWRKPLQRPLFDPPPSTPSAPKPVATPVPVRQPPPNVKLVGTFLESGQNRAVLQTAGNKVEVRKPGETLEQAPPDVEVVLVEGERVVVRFQGQEHTLTLERPERLLRRAWRPRGSTC